MATITVVTITLPVAACERLASTLGQVAAHDTANIARYNRGTKLLGHDSLKSALAPLDSASLSKDSAVRFRSAFNGGWDHLVNAIRTAESLKKGGTRAASTLAAIQRDTSFRRSTAADYTRAELDSALARYRTALISNPKDADAKWNYELALQRSRASKSGGGGKAKPPSLPKSSNGKSNKPPSIERQSMQQQRAEQLLDAMREQEQRAAKAVSVPVTPPPQGKDW